MDATSLPPGLVVPGVPSFLNVHHLGSLTVGNSCYLHWKTHFCFTMPDVSGVQSRRAVAETCDVERPSWKWQTCHGAGIETMQAQNRKIVVCNFKF